MSRSLCLAALTLTLVTASPARAQQPPQGRPAQPEGWSVSVGLAPVFGPIYTGADDYGLSVFPDLRVSYGDRFFASVPDGVGFRLFNQPGLRAGPIARLRFGRNEDSGGSPFLITGETDDLAGLGDIGVAVELGAFAEIGSGRWRARAELRQGVGAHDGIVGDLSASHIRRFGKTTVIAGPRVAFGGGDFVNVYYGIDAAQSARSGIRQYDAGGGLVSWGLGATAVRPLNARVTATLFAGYDRIAGDAARSPLVADLGDRDQFGLGLGIGYRF